MARLRRPICALMSEYAIKDTFLWLGFTGLYVPLMSAYALKDTFLWLG